MFIAKNHHFILVGFFLFELFWDSLLILQIYLTNIFKFLGTRDSLDFCEILGFLTIWNYGNSFQISMLKILLVFRDLQFYTRQLRFLKRTADILTALKILRGLWQLFREPIIRAIIHIQLQCHVVQSKVFNAMPMYLRQSITDFKRLWIYLIVRDP